jgi:hypothetical protein
LPLDRKDVDARHKAGHDEKKKKMAPREHRGAIACHLEARPGG